MFMMFDFNGNYQQFWQEEEAQSSYSAYEATTSFLHQPMSKYTANVYFFGVEISNSTLNAIALGYASLNLRKSEQLDISKHGMRVYPIPSQGVGWTLESLDKFTTITIRELTGKFIGEMVLDRPVYRCEFNAPTKLQPLYLLTVKFVDGNTQTRLIQ